MFRLDPVATDVIIKPMFTGLLRYRSFILRHAWSDLRHRYAGSGLGIAWNVIHPLAMILIFSCVFGTLFPASHPANGGKFPYTIYLCSGLFPWLAFSELVSRGCKSFLSNSAYLKKVPVPEQVFVAQNTVASTLSLSINFSLLIVFAACLGWHASWTWLLLPIPLIMLQMLGFSLGLLLGTLNVFFRDIAEWLAIGLQLLMWSVPIVYQLNPIPAWMQYNPIMPAIGATRILFLDHQIPSAQTWLALFLWPTLTLLIAVSVLNKLRPEIRDLI